MSIRESATERRQSVAVVTDSAACIPAALSEELRIGVVRLTLVVDGDAMGDGEMAADEFYQRLESSSRPPTTAGVSPAAFLDAFVRTRLDRIVCVTVSSRFSATYANAMVAAKDAVREGIVVRVVDSQYATMAQGFVALAAARAARRGAALEDVVAAAEREIPRVGLVMMLEGLDHLARGGRVPRVAAWASSLLRVKPLVEFRDREIKLAGRARTRKSGLLSLVDLLERRTAGAKRLHLAVHHANSGGDAAYLAKSATERLRPASVLTTEFTQVMTAHVGPGLVGFAYWKEA